MNKPQQITNLKNRITRLQNHLKTHKHDFNSLKIIKQLKHKHTKLQQPPKNSSMVKW
ncbi:hypothetical protein ACWNX2_00245 [Candidatus Vidania fulgoroideorum]